MPNGITLKERMAVIETEQRGIIFEVIEVKKDVKAVLENHLPHIKEQIENVDDKVDKIGWKVGVIVGIGAMIGSAILSRFIDYVFAKL